MKLTILLSLTAIPVISQTNLIIRTGGSLICRTNLTVSAGAVVLEDGASCGLDGVTMVCDEMRLDEGANLSVGGDSTLDVNGLWVNDSDFVKPDALKMPKAVSMVSEGNMATGSGDTDGDGISDRGEGSYDANSNEIADFLDAAQSTAFSHLPVQWLAEHGVTVADNDPDGDGASNLAEYHAMTDPGDPESVLRITGLSVDDVTDEVTVTWQSVSTRTYQLEHGESVDADSEAASSTVAGESGTNATSVVVGRGGASSGFFRVSVNP